jgi:hypothetical protein
MYNGPDVGSPVSEQISFNFHTGTPDRITIVDVIGQDGHDAHQHGELLRWRILCHQGWVTEDHRYPVDER